MQVGFDVSWMRDELTNLGFIELMTPQQVDEVINAETGGTMLLAINSVCGCAAANARPGAKLALENAGLKPTRLYTVFAGQEKEATAQARSYFPEYPPSSPSFALFKDGQVKALLPRHRIEGRSAEQVAADLSMIFNAYCE